MSLSNGKYCPEKNKEFLIKMNLYTKKNSIKYKTVRDGIEKVSLKH